MRAFLRAWGAALVVGESLASTLGKVMTLIVLIIGVTVLESPIQIAVWLPTWATGGEYDWQLGWVALAVIGVVYVAWSGGLAWARSRGPELDVDPDLIADGQYSMFRLRVRNDGEGLLSPDAALVWIEDEYGSSQQSVLPLNLRWSHFPVGERPRLSWHESATADVATALDRGLVVCAHWGDHPHVHRCQRPSLLRVYRGAPGI